MKYNLVVKREEYYGELKQKMTFHFGLDILNALGPEKHIGVSI